MLTHRLKSPNKLIFEWPDRDSIDGLRRTTAVFPTSIPVAALEPLAKAVHRLVSPRSKESVIYIVGSLKSLFSFVATDATHPFPPDDWDDFLYRHFIWHLSNQKNKYETRVVQWQINESLYKELCHLKFIPADAVIPSGTIRGGCTEDSIPPLTQGKKPLEAPKEQSGTLPKSILAAHGLELDDDEYLFKLRNTIQHANDVTLECLNEYWNSMCECHEIGRTLLKKIPTQKLENVLRSGKFCVGRKHLANPQTPDGLAWFLAAIRHFSINTDELSEITFESLSNFPFFRNFINREDIRSLLRKKLFAIAGNSAPPLDKKTTAHEVIARLLGFMSARDCAVACAILTIENPSFNSSSIMNADLYTQNGKYYLRARGGLGRLVFSVSKPRARKRKVSALPELSAKVITHVIECNKELRERQIRLGKRNWRKLFLIATKKQIGSNARVTKTLSQGPGVTVFNCYKSRLESCGIKKETFNLSSLRATQAVLCFLNHGSLTKVAEILNNSVAVVREHYIPSWLLIRWTNRILRILQQKIIVVATEGSPWQLESTDFETKEQLRIFITKMLIELKRGDALSEIIRKRLGKYSTADTPLDQRFIESELMIKWKPDYLAALYAYVDVTVADDVQQITTDSDNDENTVSDAEIRQLVALIRQAINSIQQDLSDAEHAVLDKLSGDALSLLEQTHDLAIHRLEHYTQMFRRSLPVFEQS